MAFRLVLGIALVFVLGNVAAHLLPSGRRLPARPPNFTEHKHFVLAWAHAFTRLAIWLVPEYVVLVFALGALRIWLFPAMTPGLGHAAWLAPALSAAGTLFVIPTAGEVPIIQVLQHFGLGAAGAAALLITLPAVSLPSLVMLGKVLPFRATAALGLGTFAFGLIAAGLAVVLRM
jgi:uncharacterized membrane protein YraQ (UPF0718 family)